MHKKVIISFLTLVSFSLFSNDKIESRLTEVKKYLYEIENSYISELSFYERREAIKKMDKITSILDSLEPETTEQNRLEFKAFKDELKFKEFNKKFAAENLTDEDRVLFFKSEINSYLFSAKQLATLLTNFNNDESRLSALVISFSSVIDTYNSELLVNTFKTEIGIKGSLNYLNSNDGISIEINNKVDDEMMNTMVLADIIEKFDSEYPFDDQKTSFLETIIPHYHMTTEQVIVILKEYLNDDKRYECLKLLYPKVNDKNNSYIILDTFVFKSTKDKVSNYMKKSNG